MKNYEKYEKTTKTTKKLRKTTKKLRRPNRYSNAGRAIPDGLADARWDTTEARSSQGERVPIRPQHPELLGFRGNSTRRCRNQNLDFGDRIEK